MTSAGKTLTTSEYSKISGRSVSTITKLLRDGKLKGQKVNGKWAIDASQAQPTGSNTEQPQNNAQKNAPPVAEPSTPAKSSSGNKTYDVDTFTRMTYLTEKGVRQWVKSGRLSGSVDARGNVFVDADNLDRSEIRHLIRK
jgi:hypothetical protein